MEQIRAERDRLEQYTRDQHARLSKLRELMLSEKAAGEKELAVDKLEPLAQVPRALCYGDLAKLPEWDPLRNGPRFQKLLSDVKPIPIVNRSQVENN